MYAGEPLYHDVASCMYDRGFELLYLSRTMVSRRRVYEGPSRGQLLFGDALFGKREDQVTNLTPAQLAKYCILLCQYGHIDIALQLLSEHSDVQELLPGFRSIFRGHANPVWRAAVMQADKVLALALHARRYNQRGTDCDRCWPIR